MGEFQQRGPVVDVRARPVVADSAVDHAVGEPAQVVPDHRGAGPVEQQRVRDRCGGRLGQPGHQHHWDALVRDHDNPLSTMISI